MLSFSFTVGILSKLIHYLIVSETKTKVGNLTGRGDLTLLMALLADFGRDETEASTKNMSERNKQTTISKEKNICH